MPRSIPARSLFPSRLVGCLVSVQGKGMVSIQRLTHRTSHGGDSHDASAELTSCP